MTKVIYIQTKLRSFILYVYKAQDLKLMIEEKLSMLLQVINKMDEYRVV